MGQSAVQEVASATALLESIVDSSDDAIYGKTLDGIVTRWNQAAEKIYGFAGSEIIGKSVSVIAPPDRPDEIDQILARIRSGERVDHYETVRMRKDGRTISVSLTVSPILDGQGKPIGASSIARDLTERKQADEQIASQTALLASIVDSSDDAIIGKTPEGIITSWNQAAEKIYGFAGSEIIGKSVLVIAPPDRPDEMDQILARIRSGERIEHYETQRKRKDGRIISVSLTVSMILDGHGKLIGAASIARDLTERKQADEQLRSASQYSRSLIEASLDPLVTISAEGKITDVNEATVKVTGVPRREADWHGFHRLLHRAD